MATRFGLPLAPNYSPRHFASFRLLLGLYLFVHFSMLIPYSPELFSREGVLPDPSMNLTNRIFPNLLNVFSSPMETKFFTGTLATLSLCLAVGLQRPLISFLLWYGWACLFNRNNLILNPGLPYIGWLLLAMCLIPKGEALRSANSQSAWRMPREIFWGAWLLLAAGYTVSGVAKLTSPSWRDGTAFLHLIDNPLARDTVLREWTKAAPLWVLKMKTWVALAFEILFLPMALWHPTRFFAWAAMAAMHLGILAFVAFADLTAGMLLVHFFTFDPSWIDDAKTLRGGRKC